MKNVKASKCNQYNKIKIFTYIVIFFFGNNYGFQRERSLTSFFTRPFCQYSSFLIPAAEKDIISIYVTPLYSHSRNSQNFSPQLLFDGKKELLCMGSNTADTNFREVWAGWLNSPSDTYALLSCKPKQIMEGALVEAQISVGAVKKDSPFKKWILGIRTSITNVKNNAGLIIDANSESQEKSLRYFFSGQNLEFSAFDDISRSVSGLENITLTMGSVYTTPYEELTAYYYTGLEIPTQSSALPTALFNPTLGNNGHWAFLTGIKITNNFYEGESLNVKALLNAEGNFFIHKGILRTCDIYGKPWSRYMTLTNKNTNEHVVAETITTIPVVVHPTGTVDLSLALEAETNYFKTKMGYNFWGKKRVETQPDDRHYFAFYNRLLDYGISGTENFTSASNSTIAKQASNDQEFIPLNYSKIDYDSAGYPATHSNTLFISFRVGSEKYFELGGFVEEGEKWTNISRYGIWGQIGLSW